MFYLDPPIWSGLAAERSVMNLMSVLSGDSFPSKAHHATLRRSQLSFILAVNEHLPTATLTCIDLTWQGFRLPSMRADNSLSITFGIVIGLFASFVQSLGLTIQRKSHVLNQSLPQHRQRVEHKRPSVFLPVLILVYDNFL